MAAAPPGQGTVKLLVPTAAAASFEEMRTRRLSSSSAHLCSTCESHPSNALVVQGQGAPVEQEAEAAATVEDDYVGQFAHQQGGSAWGAHGRQPDWSTAPNTSAADAASADTFSNAGMAPAQASYDDQPQVFGMDELERSLPEGAYASDKAAYYAQPKDAAAHAAAPAFQPPKPGENQLHTLFPPPPESKPSPQAFPPSYSQFSPQDTPAGLPAPAQQPSPRAPGGAAEASAPATAVVADAPDAQVAAPHPQGFDGRYSATENGAQNDAAYMRGPPKDTDRNGQEQAAGQASPDKRDGLADADADGSKHMGDLPADPTQGGMPAQPFAGHQGQDMQTWGGMPAVPGDVYLSLIHI